MRREEQQYRIIFMDSDCYWRRFNKGAIETTEDPFEACRVPDFYAAWLVQQFRNSGYPNAVVAKEKIRAVNIKNLNSSDPEVRHLAWKVLATNELLKKGAITARTRAGLEATKP